MSDKQDGGLTDLMLALSAWPVDRQSYHAIGNAVCICGPMSGHFTKPVAYCESEAWAAVLVDAFRAFLAERAKERT